MHTAHGSTGQPRILQTLRDELSTARDYVRRLEAAIKIFEASPDVTDKGTPFAALGDTSILQDAAGGAALVRATATDGISPEHLAKWRAELHGMTQQQALRRIAELSGGEIQTTEVRDIFVAVGLSKGKERNVNPHLHHMLSRSTEFERIGPGRYRLIEQTASDRSQSTSEEDNSRTLFDWAESSTNTQGFQRPTPK